MNAKKLFYDLAGIIVTALLFHVQSIHGQDTLHYNQIQTKDAVNQFEKFQSFKAYVTNEKLTLNIGDTLIIGKPASSATGVTSGGLTMKTYVSLTKGTWKTNSFFTPSYLVEGIEGSKIVIDKIQIIKYRMVDNFVAPIFTMHFIGFEKNVCQIHWIDQAISGGEIIIPSRGMTKQEALDKLKEAKNLLDLELIPKEKYDSLKKELSPLILGE
jgi:hypothetical protein